MPAIQRPAVLFVKLKEWRISDFGRSRIIKETVSKVVNWSLRVRSDQSTPLLHSWYGIIKKLFPTTNMLCSIQLILLQIFFDHYGLIHFDAPTHPSFYGDLFSTPFGTVPGKLATG